MNFRRKRRDRCGDECGETLVELVMATAILGTAVVALVAGIGTSIVVSDVHRKQATAGAVVRTYAEAIEGVVDDPKTGYADCAAPSDYMSPVNFEAPKGYAARVTSVRYWDAPSASFVKDCSSDAGVQELSLAVSSTDSKATEYLDLVVRKPCRDLSC